MRGKRIQSVIQFRLIRITPAGAGKTPSEISIRNFWEDHPRRCGENRLKVRIQVTHMGSPPQVRGKLIITAPDELGNGITPAGAGKTLGCLPKHCGRADHPRRCGENAPFLRRTVRRPGSPPQVRGKLAAFHAAPAARRITPAGAGKTHRGVLRSCRRKDHPRRCGENEMQIITARVSEGSPPQVRGKPERAFYCPLVLGITPAGAGKTDFMPFISCSLQDHPRRCGENLMMKPRR